MISMSVDTAKITALQNKFARYGPYALKQGLKASADYLNNPSFKQSMYPPESDAPFVWSSERQRRYVMMMLDGAPYSRTNNLANSGTFRVNESSFWIEYDNAQPYAKYVQHPSYQIIGMRTRGWKPVNTFVVSASGRIVPIFKQGVLAAWAEMDAFLGGGSPGL